MSDGFGPPETIPLTQSSAAEWRSMSRRDVSTAAATMEILLSHRPVCEGDLGQSGEAMAERRVHAGKSRRPVHAVEGRRQRGPSHRLVRVAPCGIERRRAGFERARSQAPRDTRPSRRSRSMPWELVCPGPAPAGRASCPVPR